MEAGTDCLHPRQPKIANAMRTQILGPKVPSSRALWGRCIALNGSKMGDKMGFNWDTLGVWGETELL